jgi:hypothetical protein
MLPRYVFNGVEYARREDADEARLLVIAGKARAFYAEIDTHWLGRHRSHAAETGTALPPPEKIRPPRP